MRGFWRCERDGEVLFQLESSVWWFVIAFALLGLAALAFLIYLRKQRRRLWPRRRSPSPVGVALHRDPKWVQQEIERLCAGQDPNEQLIKQMSAEDRALFEVSVIDALNNRTREGQHRLRSALIKYGYDEQCARRVMSQDLSDRVRATALLSLLRPQWRQEPIDLEHPPNREALPRALAAGRSTGSNDKE
jgi:hypothetical protein